MLDDTIAALATPYGEGGIAIVRISGTEALAVAAAVLALPPGQLGEWPTHFLRPAGFYDPRSGELIDRGLAVRMAAPHSYTGETVVELQGHGGILVSQEVLRAVLRAGARLAQPGEFTKRAFLNGKIDLAQAEAVADLIRARSDAARRLALRQMEGKLSAAVRVVQNELTGLMAAMEAMIDFPDEVAGEENWIPAATALAEALERLLAGARGGKAAREGIRVVIVGKPNAGKSSLWNALIGEERAIVTAVPGTTRDALEEVVSVQGVPVRLVDTAGIRETLDLVEALGIERAREMLRRAQVAVVVLDAAAGLGAEDEMVMSLVSEMPRVIVVNKSDLPQPQIDAARIIDYVPGEKVIWTAATTGQGLAELEAELLALALGETGEENSWLIGNLRQEQAVATAWHSLIEARAALEQGLPQECALIDLRTAWEEIGEITGESLPEQIIDRIFADFCIGK